MRNPVVKASVAFLALLALSPFALTQGRRGRPVPPGFIAEGVPKMPNPPGPAPKRDLGGAWVGPQNYKVGPAAPMTPAGEAIFKQRHVYLPNGLRLDTNVEPPPSNDPFITCDPLGFPRNLLAHAISMRGGMLFGSAPNRVLIAYEQQRVWREIWMDGRELPKKVDAKGAPDSRYYGFSVGHWEDDYTFVIDTTGLDERPWIDEVGHPQSSSARIQERYTRVDQYNMKLTVTVDDPKFYTMPWTWLTADFYWMKNQEFSESFCIPSEGIEYRDFLTKPSGIQVVK
jgi:hypothetical protein